MAKASEQIVVNCMIHNYEKSREDKKAELKVLAGGQKDSNIQEDMFIKMEDAVLKGNKLEKESGEKVSIFKNKDIIDLNKRRAERKTKNKQADRERA